MGASISKKAATAARLAEIAEYLITHPDATNNQMAEIFGVSPSTIKRDKKKLIDQWHEIAGQSINEFKSKQLAEIQQLKKEAWATGDLRRVVEAITLESKITGTTAPRQMVQKVEVEAEVVGDMAGIKDNILNRLAKIAEKELRAFDTDRS